MSRKKHLYTFAANVMRKGVKDRVTINMQCAFVMHCAALAQSSKADVQCETACENTKVPYSHLSF